MSANGSTAGCQAQRDLGDAAQYDTFGGERGTSRNKSKGLAGMLVKRTSRQGNCSEQESSLADADVDADGGTESRRLSARPRRCLPAKGGSHKRAPASGALFQPPPLSHYFMCSSSAFGSNSCFSFRRLQAIKSILTAIGVPHG